MKGTDSPQDPRETPRETPIKGGYVILARKIQKSSIARAPHHIREIWVWLLMEANHRTVRIGGQTIERGQCIRSYKDIQEGLAWYVGWRKCTYSKDDCETALKWLRKAEMVTTKKTTRGMIITILNYDFYQNPKNYENHTETDSKTTGEPQTRQTINKKENKEESKNEEKERSKGIFHERPEKSSSSSLSLPFEAYVKEYPVRDIDPEALTAVRYFLEKYTEVFNKPHPNRKPETWQSLLETITYLDGEFIELEGLRDMIDRYFVVQFSKGCDYTITHFNSDQVKRLRYYEAAYNGIPRGEPRKNLPGRKQTRSKPKSTEFAGVCKVLTEPPPAEDTVR